MIVPLLPRFGGFLTLLFLLGAADFGQARIGDTLKEEIALYGKPVHQAGTDEFAMFKKAPYYITVHFYDEKTDAITYVKAGSGSEVSFSDNEIDRLLRINGNGRKWEQSKSEARALQWQTEDKALQAVYSESKFLVITTAAYRTRLQAAENQKKTATEETEPKPASTHREKGKAEKKNVTPASKKSGTASKKSATASKIHATPAQKKSATPPSKKSSTPAPKKSATPPSKKGATSTEEHGD